MYINFTSMDFYFVRRAEVLLFRKHSSAGLYKYWGGGQIGYYLFITISSPSLNKVSNA